MVKPNSLLCPTPAGLYCPPGDFYIDPIRPVDRAVITHGHADHARAGHGAVAATVETLAIMAAPPPPGAARFGRVPAMALWLPRWKRLRSWRRAMARISRNHASLSPMGK